MEILFIMNKYHYLLIVILLTVPTSPASIFPYSQSALKKILLKNESVKELIEYKDNKNTLKLKLKVLGVINKNRAKHGLKAVMLDILACRVASKTSSEAVKGKYFGHWNLRGEKPYLRYAFSGGFHHVSENASMIKTAFPEKKTYKNILKFIITAHMEMYNEIPPNDGHRKNILNSWHTHVGIGFSLIGNDFRYYELFLNKYLIFTPINTNRKAGEVIKISGRVATPGYGVYYAIIYYEKIPLPLSPFEIAKKGSYPDFTDTRIASLPFWEINYNNNSKKFDFSFKTSRRGLYYIKIFIKKDHTGKEKLLRASTKGLSPISGIVIIAK